MKDDGGCRDASSGRKMIADGFEETHRGIEGGGADYRSWASNPCGRPGAATGYTTGHGRRGSGGLRAGSPRTSQETAERRLMVVPADAASTITANDRIHRRPAPRSETRCGEGMIESESVSKTRRAPIRAGTVTRALASDSRFGERGTALSRQSTSQLSSRIHEIAVRLAVAAPISARSWLSRTVSK